MGYAKLAFATTVTTAQALFDIVRVVTGNITSVANLSYASTTSSEIVNTLGQNWTLEYGSLADSTTSYIIDTPCVTAGKTHYVLLQASNAGTWNSSAAFNGSTSGIGLTTISGATSISSYSNPTFYSTNTTASGIGKYLISIDSNNTALYLHWSARHLLIYGKNGSGAATGFLSSIQYPETSLTQFTNTAPVLQYNFFYGLTTTFISETAPANTTNTGIILQGINVHTPTTNTTSGVYNLGNTGFGTVTIARFNPVYTLGTDGSNTYPLTPIYWSLPSVGIPILNMSQLTGFYRISTSATFSEGVFTVGGDSYVWLPISTVITGGTQSAAIALLKK